MSTTIANPELPTTDLPDTVSLIVPKFSISPLHAQALSNIYAPIEKDIFIPRAPQWKTSPLSPEHCAEHGKRHYRHTHTPRYQSEREINMGHNYTTDPRGLLPGIRLQRTSLEEPFPSKRLWPRSGNLAIDGQVKRAKVGVGAASPPPPSLQHHASRKPILKGGLVQEISLVFGNGKVTKEDFPAPFCKLPDYRFVQWAVRNMGLLGVGDWEAECEAMDVLWRTKEKMRGGEVKEVKEAKEEAKEVVKREESDVEVVEEEDEIVGDAKELAQKEQTRRMVREMRLRLYAIQAQKAEKREKRRKVLWMWKTVTKHHQKATAVEDLDMQTTKHAVKNSHMKWIKRCFCGRK